MCQSTDACFVKRVPAVIFSGILFCWFCWSMYDSVLARALASHSLSGRHRQASWPRWPTPACIKVYKKKFKINKKFEFKHNKKYLLPDKKILIACYHPSPRNVNTKLLTTLMLNRLFKKAKKIAKF